jgi:tetratricopeptide (TPR) repeat protein
LVKSNRLPIKRYSQQSGRQVDATSVMNAIGLSTAQTVTTYPNAAHNSSVSGRPIVNAGKAAPLTEEKRKEYEAAIAELTRAIKKNPYDADAFAERGSKYSSIDEYDKAVADYEAALEIRPNDQNIQVRLQSVKALRDLRNYH